MEADIAGAQRKILEASARPLRSSFGSSGIPVSGGTTLPFVVTRRWSAPAGRYREAWYLVHPETGEVYFEGPQRVVLIWGLQAPTTVEDVVREPVELAPGSYKLVFALGGLKGGEADVEALGAGADAAA